MLNMGEPFPHTSKRNDEKKGQVELICVNMVYSIYSGMMAPTLINASMIIRGITDLCSMPMMHVPALLK
jgi:hypothetical protein